MKGRIEMDKKLARLIFNECRDWRSIQSMMTQEEYKAFLKFTEEIQNEEKQYS